MATESTKNLRHRASLYENNNNNTTGISISEKAAANSNSYNRHMAYSRRSIATPYSGGGNGNGNAFPKSKNLTSYRNKILIILVITSFYTTFLYQRGQCSAVPI
jgi:hypothetical protein